jgi:DNA-binding response OmpR family regulator
MITYLIFLDTHNVNSVLGIENKVTKTPTAIVIEDDENMLTVFTEWIRMSGISVLATGTDGKDAVELFDELKPDVVILDLMMPEYDGFYAILGIREKDPHAKILVLTADVTEKTKRRLDQLKSISLMYKPYDLDDVVHEVKRLVSETVTA